MELGRAGVCLERQRYLSKLCASVSGIAALAGLGARCECVTTACIQQINKPNSHPPRRTGTSRPTTEELHI